MSLYFCVPVYQCTTACATQKTVNSHLTGPVSKCLPSLAIPAKSQGDTSFSFHYVWCEQTACTSNTDAESQTCDRRQTGENHGAHLTSPSADQTERVLGTRRCLQVTELNQLHSEDSPPTHETRTQRKVSNGGILALVSSPPKAVT